MSKLVYTLYAAGDIAAIAVSYAVNQDVCWAIVHGFFGWTYIAYLGAKLYLNSNPALLDALRT
jgi:triacylglycerol esterase/lipase EstA (alpha/beta hydrolase family)